MRLPAAPCSELRVPRRNRLMPRSLHVCNYSPLPLGSLVLHKSRQAAARIDVYRPSKGSIPLRQLAAPYAKLGLLAPGRRFGCDLGPMQTSASFSQTARCSCVAPNRRFGHALLLPRSFHSFCVVFFSLPPKVCEARYLSPEK